MDTDIALTAYRAVQSKYADLAIAVYGIVQSFPDASTRFQKLEHRAKSILSFADKCRKQDSNGTLRYTDPLSQITDLAGVRIITFVPSTVTEVCDFITGNFAVQEQRDVGEERFASGNFGYQSIHFLVKLKDDRLALPDFGRHRGLVCEIQVRTVLQHAWAEMEHDIRYKSQHDIPRSLEKRFLALAGMLEIADREFQSLQDEDVRLKSDVQASLEEDLTKSAIAESSVQSEETSRPAVEGAPARARDFVVAGKFAEAIQLYTEMLAVFPTAHTFYIGRAKARFLAGDQRGALEDLNRSEKLSPNDPTIASLRIQMSEGRVFVRQLTDGLEALDYLKSGNAAMDVGNAQEAFAAYSEAQARGYNYAFSIFNKSMASVLGGDYTGATRLLDALKLIPGSPMEINIKAMHAILGLLQGGDGLEWTASLQESLVAMPEFNYEMSPIRHLDSGLKATSHTALSAIEPIFAKLRDAFSLHMERPY